MAHENAAADAAETDSGGADTPNDEGHDKDCGGEESDFVEPEGVALVLDADAGNQAWMHVMGIETDRRAGGFLRVHGHHCLR